MFIFLNKGLELFIFLKIYISILIFVFFMTNNKSNENRKK